MDVYRLPLEGSTRRGAVASRSDRVLIYELPELRRHIVGCHREDIGGRCLLLQRLAEIGRALPQFVEQPRVLDSNDGLVRKAGKERDLPIVERTNLLAKDDDDANELVLREHRHAKRGPNATKLDRIDSNWMTFGVSLSRCEVGD